MATAGKKVLYCVIVCSGGTDGRKRRRQIVAGAEQTYEFKQNKGWSVVGVHVNFWFSFFGIDRLRRLAEFEIQILKTRFCFKLVIQYLRPTAVDNGQSAPLALILCQRRRHMTHR